MFRVGPVLALAALGGRVGRKRGVNFHASSAICMWRPCSETSVTRQVQQYC